jgi:hypothetical protein
MMKRKILTYAIITLLLIMSSIPASAKGNRVDDLRGQWVFEWTFYDGETPPPLTLFINDIEPGQAQDTYLAAGCMRSPYMDTTYPLSLVAVFSPGTKTYNLTIYSTVIPADPYGPIGSPFVIHFAGNFEVKGPGVSDDLALGEFQSGGPSGTWQGTHHDRRQVKCLPVDTGSERLNMDLTAHISLDGSIENAGYQLEANGIMIVASALRVTAPDGQEFIAPFQSDIWAPGVDFVNEFRFGLAINGALPISGQPYQFVLLDILGNSIPGTETQDTWTHCVSAAPAIIQINPGIADGEDVEISWDGVPEVLGEFVPGKIGYYQFGIHPENWEGSQFGADGMADTNHVIPWASFIPDDPGVPDGRNVGVALNEFLDGPYLIDVMVMYEANPAFGGYGHECGVNYGNQAWRMEKSGSTLTFSPNEP